MPKVKTRSSSAALSKAARRPLDDEVDAAIAWLQRHGTKATRDGMARYAIPSTRAFGVAVRDIQSLAKRLGRNHDLALALWGTGWYEARMLAAYVDEPSAVTPAQMDRWCRDFDNWAICSPLRTCRVTRTGSLVNTVSRAASGVFSPGGSSRMSAIAGGRRSHAESSRISHAGDVPRPARAHSVSSRIMSPALLDRRRIGCCVLGAGCPVLRAGCCR
jgi:hypothetical protein